MMAPVMFGSRIVINIHKSGSSRAVGESQSKGLLKCSCAGLTFKQAMLSQSLFVENSSFQHVSTPGSIELHSGRCQRGVAGVEAQGGLGLATFRVSVANT